MGNYVADFVTSFTQRYGPITALAAYDDTTSIVVDIRAQNDKVILVKNTGAGGLTYRILASIDSAPDAIEYDITHLGDTAVGAAAQNLQKFSDYYTFIKIQVKDVGGVAVVKVAAAGN
jgi:tRNA A58 N-methylase Trm61